MGTLTILCRYIHLLPFISPFSSSPNDGAKWKPFQWRIQLSLLSTASSTLDLHMISVTLGWIQNGFVSRFTLLPLQQREYLIAVVIYSFAFDIKQSTPVRWLLSKLKFFPNLFQALVSALKSLLHTSCPGIQRSVSCWWWPYPSPGQTPGVGGPWNRLDLQNPQQPQVLQHTGPVGLLGLLSKTAVQQHGEGEKVALWVGLLPKFLRKQVVKTTLVKTVCTELAWQGFGNGSGVLQQWWLPWEFC